MTVLAVVSGIALGSAIVLLATFFVTRVERYDRLAEWAFVLFAACAIPTILAVGQLLPVDDPVRVLVTAVGVVGVATVGLGELVVTLHLVDFRRLAPVVTVGFVAFLGWIGGVSALTVLRGGFPTLLGWLGLTSILFGVAVIGWIAREPGVLSGEREPARAPMTAFFVPLVGIVLWMVWLGLSL